MGGLWFDGAALPRPTRPWAIDLSAVRPYDGLAPGDVADFSAAPDWERWRLGDTPGDPAARLSWRPTTAGVLVCDRVILMRVSWADLEAVGLVTGRDIVLDGQRWRCRLIEGGDAFAKPGDGRAGASGPTEWDRLIAADAPPEAQRGPASEALRLGAHNTCWHWVGAYSWTALPFAGDAAKRVCRGFHAPQFFYLNTVDHRHEDIGWRPMLEPLD
jgi:hypothetical protein